MKEMSIRMHLKEQTYLRIAEEVASLSLCTSDRVGAVLVNSYGRVSATGYNGVPKDFPHKDSSCFYWCKRSRIPREEKDPGYIDCPSIHAEANALLSARWEDKQGATLYISSKPCHSCSKLIANSGVNHVIYRVTEAGANRPDYGIDLLHKCGILCEGTL